MAGAKPVALARTVAMAGAKPVALARTVAMAGAGAPCEALAGGRVALGRAPLHRRLTHLQPQIRLRPGWRLPAN